MLYSARNGKGAPVWSSAAWLFLASLLQARSAAMLTIWITLASLVCLRGCLADVGGHDLFTSLAQLEILWGNERQVVQLLHQIRAQLRGVAVDPPLMTVLDTYIDSFDQLGLGQEPNYAFLGHPLNAYHLIRHVAMNRAALSTTLLSNATIPQLIPGTKQHLDKLEERNAQDKLPDREDILGAAYGLVRILHMYKVDRTTFAKQGRIVANFREQPVFSEPSVLLPNSYDLLAIASKAAKVSMHDIACDFLSLALNKSLEELSGRDTIVSEMRTDPAELKKSLVDCRLFHDKFLLKNGPMSLGSCHETPYNSKLAKRARKLARKRVTEPLLDRNAWLGLQQQNNPEEAHRLTLLEQYQSDRLCRGEKLRSNSKRPELKCMLVHNGLAWMRLGPAKVELHSVDPAIYVIKQILLPHECDSITRFLAPLLDFPPGRMNSKAKRNDWTMKNCWPTEDDNLELDKLNRRIEHITELEAAANKNYSERFMCGNYGIGGHYGVHPDYYEDFGHEGAAMMKSGRGNRVATILTLLESPRAGGGTVWPYIGLAVFPEKGDAVFWHNVRPASQPDFFTRHAACPVLLGQKWIGNKWVGYNAQWKRRSCKLHPQAPFDLISG